MHLHDGLQVKHVSVVLRAERVLAGGVEAINLLLELRVRPGVGQQTVEDACQRA